MEAALYDTLILSDVHLGAEVSRACAAARMLREHSFRRLILLGDIFADLNFGRLKKEHWRFLGAIRKLSNPKRRVEVVWVEGNHDLGLTNDAMHLEQDGIHYYNSGGWIDARLTYITVGEDGVQIHEYKESAEDRAEEEPTGLHSEADHDSALFEDTEYEEVGR